MTINQLILRCVCISAALVLFSSCGGGGGVTPPFKTMVNKLNITRVGEWDGKGNVLESRSFPLMTPELRAKWRDRHARLAKDYRAGNGLDFDFCADNYTLLSRDKKILFIKNGKVEKSLSVPRYEMWMNVLSVKINGGDYLVLLVEQQKTSFSSTLFILDCQLEVVYKESMDAARMLALIKGSRGEEYLHVGTRSQDHFYLLQNKL